MWQADKRGRQAVMRGGGGEWGVGVSEIKSKEQRKKIQIKRERKERA